MLKRILLILSLLSLPVYSQHDARNRYLLGVNFEQSGEYEKAKQIFEELYNGNPQNYQYFDALNRIYLQLKDYDNSINIIEDRIKANENNINLYGMLGKTYYIKGDENKAFDIWDQALHKAPANQNSYRVIANYAIQLRAFNKAIEYLNKGKSVSETPRLFSYDLASIYALTMRFKDAAKEYCEIISSHPKQYQLVESRILSYIKKPDALSQTIEVVKNFEGNDKVVIDYLLARLYMEANKFDKAYDLYLNIDDKQNNQGSDLYSFANFAYSEKHYDLAAKSYNELIKRHPNSSFVSSAKLGYAKTLEEALNIETSDSAESWKPFFKISQVDNDKVEKVINAYSGLINLYPHSEVASEALLRIGRIIMYKQNDVSSAEKYFDRIIKEFPRSKFISDTYLELANIDILKDDFDSAKNNLSKVIDNKGSGLDKINLARYNLAKVDFYRADFPSAKRLLGEILNNLKDNTANDAIELSLLLNTTLNDSSNLALYAKGELLVKQGDYKKASSIFDQIASYKRSFMLANKASLREAETELALDNYDKSISILQEISEKNEQNLYADKALYLLGNIYQYGMKDDTKALDMYEKLLAKFPNSLYLDVAREEIIKIRNKVS